MSGYQSHNVTSNQFEGREGESEKVSSISFNTSSSYSSCAVMLTCKGLDKDLHGAMFTILFNAAFVVGVAYRKKGKARNR